MREARKEFLQKMSHEEALRRAHRLAGILRRKADMLIWRTLLDFVCDWDDVHEEMDEHSPEICLYEIDYDLEYNATGKVTGVMIDDDIYIVDEWVEA